MAYTAIDDPEAYFQAVLYSGTGSNQAVTLGGDTDMQPDVVWIKSRTNAEWHNLNDSVRGADKQLHPNDTSAEIDPSTESFVSFNSDGFTVGTNDNANNDAETFVAWCWKESATSGFDIVSFTGDDTARTISHSLSAVPHMMIVKARSAGYGWAVYHAGNTSAPETETIWLNSTDATADRTPEWNDTAPTSSVFTLGDGESVNKDTITYIAYLWSEKQGFSKFGGWTGNGNADGAFVYTGFRPSMILLKVTDITGDWRIFDTTRDTYNVADAIIYPSAANAEGTETFADFLSNGFKIRSSSDSYNGSGNTYIYAAFAEQPFVNSNGVPCNAR